jgi:UDP:flavonoid glycosyltransferase YjiC (YdhE family)
MAFPSREIAPLGAPSWPRWLYPFWWWLAGFAIERVITRRSNDLRRRVGLPPVRHILRLIRESPGLNLIAVSSVFCNRPRDWNPGNELCGFFDLGDDQGWQMPPDLEAFLRAGPAPVFFGLGSVLSADPSAQSREQSVRLLVDAAGAARCRAIVQACWAELNFNVPSSVFRLERAPHKAVFPHCAAIVHAGGAGTTHTALRAGVPSVVVPHANDQIAWAKELHRLGVAPAPIPRRKATVAKLALAIEDVLAHPAMREHAQLLAVTMKDEDGVARAIALLEAQRRAGLVSETRMAPKLESV